MDGSSIVNKLGGGSSIDTSSLIKDLVNVEKQPEQNRLDKREKLLNTQISDYGKLRSSLSDLQDAVGALTNQDNFDAKSVSVPDTSLISLSNINAKANAGSYQLKIEQVAQAQSLSSTTYASADAAVGKGTLTLRLGGWNSGLDTFTVDPNKTGATITIDDTNNSLSGLRDAINQADIGVQASIVADGDNYRLQITGPTGASNELELSASEDNSAPGLANFNFNSSTQNLSQQQEGLDAKVRVNGLLVSRDSNTVTDVIEGLTFTIFNQSSSEVVNINISEDHSKAEKAIRDFVDTYNTYLDQVNTLTAYNVDTGESGSLHNDSLAGNLTDTVRNFLSAAVPGIKDGFANLGSLGIKTKRDGSLEINENPDDANTNFTAAMNQHYDQVRDLFVPNAESNDARISVKSTSAKTQPGDHQVVISQNATHGTLEGNTVAAGFPLDTTGKDYSFDVSVDGNSASIAIPNGTIYNSADELAADIQSRINLSADVQSAGAKVKVHYDSGNQSLVFSSEKYGSKSSVTIDAVGADAGELGLQKSTGNAGQDVAGTVDGKEAFGYGNVLLPAVGSDAQGLSMIVKPGATNATVSFSRGLAGGLTDLLATYVADKGLIDKRKENINDRLADITDDRKALERRTDAYRSRLQNQFLSMQLVVNNLKNTGTFLDGLTDRLPFTAKN